MTFHNNIRAAAVPLILLALATAVALAPAACGNGETPIHPGIDNRTANAAIAGQEYIVILAVNQHRLEDTAVAMHQLGYELHTTTGNESNTSANMILRRISPDPDPGAGTTASGQ